MHMLINHMGNFFIKISFNWYWTLQENYYRKFLLCLDNPKKTTLLRDSYFIFILSNNINILDLVDERLIINDGNDLSQNDSNSNSDSIIEDSPEQNLNSREKGKISKQDTGISNRKRNTKKFENSPIEKYSKNDLFINSIAKMEQKKDNISSKNAQIERIQQRIENIKNDLLNIKEGFIGLPNYIDKIIDKEVDSEMMIYLTKN